MRSWGRDVHKHLEYMQIAQDKYGLKFQCKHLSQTNKWDKTHGKFQYTKNKHFIEIDYTQVTISLLPLQICYCYHQK